MTPIHKKNSEANEEKASSPRSRRYKTITSIVIALLLFPLGYFIYSYYQAKEEENIRIAAKIESERIAKEEAERKAKAEAERHAKEEAERRAKAEAERIAKEESERKAKAEAERVAKEEAERKAKAEAERIAKEEAERKAKAEAERHAKEEAERRAKAEAERIAEEEAKRLAKEEAKRKAKDEAHAKLKSMGFEPPYHNLDYACRNNNDSDKHREIMRLFLTAGANPNSSTGRTALHDACTREHIECIKMLISAGANVNAKDWDSLTPLHYAAYTGNREAVKILIDAGADVNVEGCYATGSPFLDNYRIIKKKATPLDIAILKGHTRCAKLIRAAGGE